MKCNTNFSTICLTTFDDVEDDSEHLLGSKNMDTPSVGGDKRRNSLSRKASLFSRLLLSTPVSRSAASNMMRHNAKTKQVPGTSHTENNSSSHFVDEDDESQNQLVADNASNKEDIVDVLSKDEADESEHSLNGTVIRRHRGQQLSKGRRHNRVTRTDTTTAAVLRSDSDQSGKLLGVAKSQSLETKDDAGDPNVSSELSESLHRRQRCKHANGPRRKRTSRIG
ncbi:hypothetical protein MPSEU_000193300 [Mayamaea pseudoterrestris]|nr:hypothetical protein MPSEU_000193300 [Mayamaea pseudoterrestris]